MIKAQGFSLFELMIVLFVIAVMSGGVTIVVSTFSSPEKRLNKTGQQLFSRMNFALDEALMQRRLLGFRLDDTANINRYYWYRYDNEQWSLLSEPLNPQSIPEDIVVSMTVDEDFTDRLLEKSLNDRDDDSGENNIQNEEDKKKGLIPDIVFYPNSDVSDFKLQLTLNDAIDQNNVVTIYIDERGELAYSSGDELTNSEAAL